MWLGEPYILEAGIAALAKDGITAVRLQATRGTASGGPCRRGAGKLEGDDSGRHQQCFMTEDHLTPLYLAGSATAINKRQRQT
jgi:hypothetical protein